MVPVDLAALDADPAFDAAVLATPEIDRFCSSSAWVLSAAESVMPARVPWVRRGAAGWLALAEATHPSGFTYLEPLELAWGLASPMVGADVPAAMAEAVAAIDASPRWKLLALAGLPEGGAHHRALAKARPGHWRARRGEPCVRCVASLDGGVDGWRSRRSRDFRRGLGKSERRAHAEGLRFVDVGDVTTVAEVAALYARIQAIEAGSWKAQGDVGISTSPMRELYGAMLPRLGRTGRLRALIGILGDRDVAYILGGVLGDTYRGLQFGFANDLRRLALGNLAQLAQLERLAAEGVACYDLGTEMDYKWAWAEGRFATELLVISR